MDIKIRKAVKADCEKMMQLIRELAIYEREPEAVTVSMDHFIESGFGEKPVWEAFVAEASPDPFEETSPNLSKGKGEEASPNPRAGGMVIGFALYYIRYSTWKGQRMYLEDLLVTEKMRGYGTGKLLFDKLIEECKDKKYTGLVWQVLDWNEPAINFYKKFEGVKFDGEWVNCSIEF
jgi:GNAT superfamily N-acetyltransferase